MCEGRGGRDRRVSEKKFVRGTARRREIDLECRCHPGHGSLRGEPAEARAG